MKKIKIWLGHKLYRWEKTGGPARQPASPSARQPAGRTQKRNPFYHVGPARPGPFNTGQKRAGPKRVGLARFDTPSNYLDRFGLNLVETRKLNYLICIDLQAKIILGSLNNNKIIWRRSFYRFEKENIILCTTTQEIIRLSLFIT